MLWKISKKFKFAADRIIPDSFVFCVILTFAAFALGCFVPGASPLKMITSWYDGLWSMIAFAFQMSFMVICCGAAAKSPAVERFLKKVAKLPRSRAIAIVILLVFGLVSSLINWAFSLILAPILAMQLSKQIKGLHFPLLIAAGYSTMILGQVWCPSASVYALVATKGHFLEKSIGIIGQQQTTYNSVNTVLFFILAIVTIIVGVMTKPPEDEIIMYREEEEDNISNVSNMKQEKSERTFADKMNENRLIMLLIGIAGLVYIFYTISKTGFIASLNFNFVIFIFLTLNTFLYSTPIKFVNAFTDSIKPATQVMLQFPFYGGIMGIMTASGLSAVVADQLIKIATPETLPVWSYISASVLNLFIPSQGGQWIVQGPILAKAAHALNADMSLVINAFVYGDEATNLIQPLYVIPALSLVNMKLKDVWGFMAFIWAIWFVITCIGFLVLPGLLL
ncbi:short-chain fatty acids transporter [Clostridium homopropionicum DSM 5847]|uniref:Short-chain fatty acids transporter n=1 Tax=Clostridium homopropionicum DSM 5847 TaxID=1121318 RepID=A0A0L6Z583_9CLOT|nr:TIGR00366 family protein [Clostridium homopropionicum]KOA18129.1 short-chain fatty acids transporter [Clostridium homopropionicum DSM 5847]SFG96381.1 short-chain fatty acids transporter [Clostridium homopropionicum]